MLALQLVPGKIILEKGVKYGLNTPKIPTQFSSVEQQKLIWVSDQVWNALLHGTRVLIPIRVLIGSKYFNLVQVN